jgi:O-methyltransferase involved in polyketide biosynthesis
VYEVDHPASQVWKRERIADPALPVADTHFFVPIDFEIESLRHGLDRAGSDWHRPAMFSWLGVTPYLAAEAAEAIEATLRTIRCCETGSEVVLSYLADDSMLDDNAKRFPEIFSRWQLRPVNPSSLGGQLPGLKR